MEQVILIDEFDKEIGTMGKHEAHRKGIRHRAFSIFIFGNYGKLLIQKRASTKYHCAGLWTDTCSGHPRPSEEISEAAERRLKEEMGITCELTSVYKFFYKVELDHGFTENECDYAFVGTTDTEPICDPNEVAEHAWVEPEQCIKDMKENPEHYAYWFRISLPELYKIFIKTL